MYPYDLPPDSYLMMKLKVSSSSSVLAMSNSRKGRMSSFSCFGRHSNRPDLSEAVKSPANTSIAWAPGCRLSSSWSASCRKNPGLMVRMRATYSPPRLSCSGLGANRMYAVEISKKFAILFVCTSLSRVNGVRPYSNPTAPSKGFASPVGNAYVGRAELHSRPTRDAQLRIAARDATSLADGENLSIIAVGNAVLRFWRIGLNDSVLVLVTTPIRSASR
jgi:hypothetical protein